MLIDHQLDLASGSGDSVLLVGLTVDDVTRLRAGETLSVPLREVGLGESGSFAVSLAPLPPAAGDGHLSVSDGMLRWMRDSTPIRSKFSECGLPGRGTVVAFHRNSDEETAAALIAYKRRLCSVDGSVVTAYRLDRATGHVSVERFERSGHAPTAARRSRSGPILVGAVVSIVCLAEAVRQPHARAFYVLVAIALGTVAGWSFRRKDFS